MSKQKTPLEDRVWAFGPRHGDIYARVRSVLPIAKTVVAKGFDDDRNFAEPGVADRMHAERWRR